jgi:hypothetical protein
LKKLRNRRECYRSILLFDLLARKQKSFVSTCVTDSENGNRDADMTFQKADYETNILMCMYGV